MIPVKQTRFGGQGNCHAACIASIFEVALDEVPFPSQEEVSWPEYWRNYIERVNSEFLIPRGYYQASFQAHTADTGELLSPAGYSILSVRTATEEGAHAVVCQDGEIVWNPDPNGLYDEREPLDWTIFVALDPSKTPHEGKI